MKKIIIGLFAFFILGFAETVTAQDIAAQRLPAGVNAIPKFVTANFKTQYPNVLLKGWFVTHLTYWQNDYSSDWYNGWYGKRTIVVYPYEKPTYFEVEFMQNPGELSRAIYNIYGYWYETRTQIKGLTLGILEALQKSKYSDWKVSVVKEKLESPAWPFEIYRFQVSKGLRMQILRMDAEGHVIQVKDLGE